MSIPQDLLDRARQLPEADRAALVEELLLSLEPTEKEPGYDEAWAAEIQARLDRYEQDPSIACDYREALGRIRESLKRRTPA